MIWQARWEVANSGNLAAMTKEDDYRRNAAETLKLASRAASSGDKGRLLSLAEKWLDLAERTRDLARRRAGRVRVLHPLIHAKMPDVWHDTPSPTGRR